MSFLLNLAINNYTKTDDTHNLAACHEHKICWTLFYVIPMGTRRPTRNNEKGRKNIPI
jgi:hypothetical protein